MKILLIMADAHMHTLRIGPHVRSMREAPLTLTTLAALAPPELDIQWRVVDESIDVVPLDFDADLVGISVLTGTANRAYALADHFRTREITTVLGGVHVTILPEEAARHADSIVVGMAEQSWPALLRDFARGDLQAEYTQDLQSNDVLEGVPTPRVDLQRNSGYMMPYTVHATRGCRKACDFCSVPAVFPRFFKRPVSDVIRDIRAVPGRRFGFNDVSLLEDREYAKELLSALIPLKKKWGGLATVDAIRDEELLDLIAKSGCVYLLFGLESIHQPTLNSIYKGFNKAQEYDEAVSRLHDCGISIQGCFVFGFDSDDPGIFERTVQRVEELKIDIPRYSIYTPYPGTSLFRRLETEGRILSHNWADYDTMHVVYQPAQMTPEQLYEGFKRAYRQTFKFLPILRRTISLRMYAPVNFVGNLTYRIFVKRLAREARFRQPSTRPVVVEAP